MRRRRREEGGGAAHNDDGAWWGGKTSDREREDRIICYVESAGHTKVGWGLIFNFIFFLIRSNDSFLNLVTI